MATLSIKTKFAAMSNENHEESSRNNQSWDRNTPRIPEDSFTQESKEIEGRVTEKLSQEYSRSESFILIAPFKFDGFLLNSQVRVRSGLVRETPQTSNKKNREANEDSSQNDLHPEVDVFVSQSCQHFDTDVAFYKFSHNCRRNVQGKVET